MLISIMPGCLWFVAYSFKNSTEWLPVVALGLLPGAEEAGDVTKNSPPCSFWGPKAPRVHFLSKKGSWSIKIEQALALFLWVGLLFCLFKCFPNTIFYVATCLFFIFHWFFFGFEANGPVSVRLLFPWTQPQDPSHNCENLMSLKFPYVPKFFFPPKKPRTHEIWQISGLNEVWLRFVHMKNQHARALALHVFLPL